MKLYLLTLALIIGTAASADFKILKDAQEFKQLVAESKVPVVVQFAAYWCGPCQDLKATFTSVAKDYSDDQVLLAYVDAYENKELKSYLQGGYPTTRTFIDGKLGEKKFTGSESASFVRGFIDSVISKSFNFCPLELRYGIPPSRNKGKSHARSRQG